jgi:hypothetical protein
MRDTESTLSRRAYQPKEQTRKNFGEEGVAMTGRLKWTRARHWKAKPALKSRSERPPMEINSEITGDTMKVARGRHRRHQHRAHFRPSFLGPVNIFFREVILYWLSKLILWNGSYNELEGWKLKNNFFWSRWFPQMIWKVYAREHKRITFNHIISCPKKTPLTDN